MKTKHLLLILFVAYGSIATAQSKLFDKFANDDDVTAINISKTMFELMKGRIKSNDEDVDLKNVIGKIESLKIITSDNAAKKEKMRSDFKSQIEKGYEELMSIKKGKSNTVTFNIKKKGDIINELIMLINGDNQFMAMQLLGNFTLKDIEEIYEKVQ